MTVFLEYLDHLPRVPDVLLAELQEQEQSQSEIYVTPLRYIKDETLAKERLNIFYRRREITEKLAHWINSNISDRYDEIGWQVHDPAVRGGDEHLPHTDGFPRRWALNYVFSTGGNNVLTTFYQEHGHPLERDWRTMPGDAKNLKPVSEFMIEPQRWHLLNTQVLHGVKQIESQRMAISISLNSENPRKRIFGSAA